MKSYSLCVVFMLINQLIYAKSDSIIKPQVRYSPIVIANLKTSENQYIKCTYGQPLKKGREIFGNIVPYGKLWRTGANEATEITFTRDFKIGDKLIQAGTYTLFTIPNQDKWTIILNSELGQWGDFNYDARKNILVHEVNCQEISEIYEGFTINFEELMQGIQMNLIWDKTKVPVLFENVIAPNVETNNKRKRRKSNN